MSKSQPMSKQAGKAISQMIAVAQEVKHMEQAINGVGVIRSKDEAYHAEIERLTKRVASLESQNAEVKKRKLANFSLEDIENELNRRKQQAQKAIESTRRAKSVAPRF